MRAMPTLSPRNFVARAAGRIYSDACIDTYQPQTPAQVEAWAVVQQLAAADHPGNLFLLGGHGTGKTYAAAALMRQYAEWEYMDTRTTGEQVRWVTAEQIVREFRAAQAESDEAAAEYLRAWAELWFVVIDDLRALLSAADVRAFDTLMYARYCEGNNVTCITSRLDLDGLCEAFGDHVIDRMAEGARLGVFVGPSYRTRFKWDGRPDDPEPAPESPKVIAARAARAKAAPVATTRPATVAAPPPTTDAGESITLEEVSARVNALTKTHRAQLVEALKGYGAKRTPDLKPEQFAAFMSDLDAIESAAHQTA